MSAWESRVLVLAGPVFYVAFPCRSTIVVSRHDVGVCSLRFRPAVTPCFWSLGVVALIIPCAVIALQIASALGLHSRAEISFANRPSIPGTSLARWSTLLTHSRLQFAVLPQVTMTTNPYWAISSRARAIGNPVDRRAGVLGHRDSRNRRPDSSPRSSPVVTGSPLSGRSGGGNTIGLLGAYVTSWSSPGVIPRTESPADEVAR